MVRGPAHAIAHSTKSRPEGGGLTSNPDSKPAIELGTRPAARRNAVPRAGGLVTLAIGAFFLVFWMITPLADREWVGASMKTNTALSLVMAALSLLLLDRGRIAGLTSAALATLTAFVGVATLLEYASGLDLHLDQVVALDFPLPQNRGLPNRMAPNTALVFALAGFALLSLPSRQRAVAVAGQALALGVLGICVLAEVGYLYNATALYQPTQYIGMSPYTAAAGTILGLAMVAARQDVGIARLMVNDGPAGYLARRLVLVAALAPAVLGWLRLEGEALGLYTKETGTSLLVLLTMATFVLVVAILARTLDGVDVRRRQAENQLRSSGELTAALSRATSVGEVVDAATRLGLPALGASAGSLMVISPDGKSLRMASSRGYSAATVGTYQSIPLDKELPICEAVRTEQPVFIENPAEMDRRYPGLSDQKADSQAWVALPVTGRERTIGVLGLSFAHTQTFDERQRQRLVEMARQCAQALDRALLIDDREEARVLLETVLSAAPVGLAYLDRELRYVRVNAALAAVHGLPAQDHVGRHLSEVLPPDLVAFAQPHLEEVLATNLPRTARSFSGQLPGAPGETRHYLISFYPVPDRAGLPVGVGKIMVDVTAEQRARESAEDANRAKDEFMAMLGHELRNPLSPILTALQMMKLRGGDVHGKERAIIERQVRQMARLVDDLLDVSRITRGKVELKKDRVLLEDIVAQAVEVASPLFEERVHRLSSEVPPGVAVVGDEHRLTQVLANLLTNAAKYTPPGGRIEIIGGEEDGKAVIRVKDSGKGIPPELLSRVFDLFVQGNRTAERSGGGLGLGLSIVRMLVTMHGGEVTATSEGAGKGSEFKVTLPLDRTAGAALVAERPDLGAPAARPRRGRRVLVVDDNRDAAELLAELLDMEGYETKVAFDGPTALRVATEFQPELAFLDIGLPVMDGYDLARRLRAMSQGPLVLVAVTGYGQPSDRARSAAAGFDEHLVKPIGIDSALAIADGTWKGAAAGSAAG
jgi:PAS domain S-box-containing protein